MSKPELTAVIIARNAERTIGECVRALSFCNRVLVGENNSTDKTAVLAQQAGAVVKSVPWQGFGKTKNQLLQSIKTGWILSIDADEIVSTELGAAILEKLSQEKPADGYYLSRENYFLGQKIQHCGWSPDWQLRLFRAGRGQFEEKNVHEALKVTGCLEYLPQPLRHYTYPTVADYLQRMNEYTSLAAQDRQERGRRFSLLRLVFDTKWTWLKMYVLKQGFRDGFPGLALCSLSALNTLVKHAKHWEAGRRAEK